MTVCPVATEMTSLMVAQARIAQIGIDWLAQGKLDVIVRQTFALDRAAEAHRVLEAGGVGGKLVLTMDQG